MNTLVWKDSFQRIMEAARDIRPGVFDFVPESYSFPVDFNKFQREFKKEETYICKP